MNARLRMEPAVHAAAFGAAALIASQVAGKAVRDAFFLTHFAVSALPAMVILASLLSICAGLATARLTASVAPRRLFPMAFVGSAALLLLEWAISLRAPAAAAVMIYLQMAVLGSVLISGFWSLLGDRFDARSAKKQFTRVIAAGTLGGIVGGFLAERVGSSLGIASMLPILAFLHLLCALIATGLSPARPPALRRSGATVQKAKAASSLGVLKKVPYVRNLALLILFSTMGTALLDYAFKVRVSAGYETGDQLVRLFALFYAAVGVATFLVQLILSRVAVEKLGVARTVGSLPLALLLGGVGGLLVPGVGMAFAMRGSEAMVRSSFFKSGYEMLYAAVPRRERRATKSLLDVGVERLGDLLGGLVLGGISWIVSPPSTAIVLTLAVVLGFAGFWISRRLQHGYVQALENSLLSQSVSTPAPKDLRTFGNVLRTLLSQKARSETPKSAPVQTPATDPALRDPILQNAAILRSPDAAAIRRLLAQQVSPLLAPSVIGLLAWDEVSASALDALRRMGDRITGQLVDALLDPEQEFAIRRRIPRVLAEFDLQRAVDGLIAALADARFEVRFHSGRALTQLQERNPNLVMDREAIIRTVEREFEASPEVWRHHRILDTTHDEPEGTLAVEHVFRLLALVYARDPLRIAYGALRSGDDYLRRTALEYLEQILPLALWQRIVPLIEEPATAFRVAV